MAATMLGALFDGVNATPTANAPSTTAMSTVTSAVNYKEDFLGQLLSITNAAAFPTATISGIDSDYTNHNATNHTDHSSDGCESLFCSMLNSMGPWTTDIIITIGIVVVLGIMYCLGTCIRDCFRLHRRQKKQAKDEEIEMHRRSLSRVQQERLNSVAIV